MKKEIKGRKRKQKGGILCSSILLTDESAEEGRFINTKKS